MRKPESPKGELPRLADPTTRGCRLPLHDAAARRCGRLRSGLKRVQQAPEPPYSTSVYCVLLAAVVVRARRTPNQPLKPVQRSQWRDIEHESSGARLELSGRRITQIAAQAAAWKTSLYQMGFHTPRASEIRRAPYDVPGRGLARLCEVRRRRGGFTAGTCALMGTLAAACRLTTGDVFRGTGEPPRATASLRWVWGRPAWAGRHVHQRFAVAGYGSWRQHDG